MKNLKDSGSKEQRKSAKDVEIERRYTELMSRKTGDASAESATPLLPTKSTDQNQSTIAAPVEPVALIKKRGPSSEEIDRMRAVYPPNYKGPIFLVCEPSTEGALLFEGGLALIPVVTSTQPGLRRAKDLKSEENSVKKLEPR